MELWYHLKYELHHVMEEERDVNKKIGVRENSEKRETELSTMSKKWKISSYLKSEFHHVMEEEKGSEQENWSQREQRE